MNQPEKIELELTLEHSGAFCEANIGKIGLGSVIFFFLMLQAPFFCHKGTKGHYRFKVQSSRFKVGLS